MSDGSTPVLGPRHSGGGFLASGATRNVLGLLGDVGAAVDDNVTSMVVCEGDLLRLGMLAVLGNFVTGPEDGRLGSPGSTAAVVVDVYTGALVVTPSYSVTREYFLEALLVLSVLAIARLTLVRRVSVSGPQAAAGTRLGRRAP